MVSHPTRPSHLSNCDKGEFSLTFAMLDTATDALVLSGEKTPSTPESTEWVGGIKGNFPVSTSVLKALPKGAQILSAERSGVSAWTKTAKLSVRLNGNEKQYFLKCSTGQGSRASAEGEYHSAVAINAAVPGLVPTALSWGQYMNGTDQYYFYLGDFHDMDLDDVPDPVKFSTRLAKLHHKGTSSNGKFGFPVQTVIGKMERTLAKSLTHQLKDVIQYDNNANGRWPELEVACTQLIDVVIPRLLGILQSDGRQIKPSLIHGDLWENNIGTDRKTGDLVIFDPGCTYSHNEMEFGTWRCWWALYFKSTIYMTHYQRHFEASEPAEEWDDRNRLYSLYPYFTDSAGHPGSISRKIAYNDILFLCEKYSPLNSLEKYDPQQDVALNGGHIPFIINQLEE